MKVKLKHVIIIFLACLISSDISGQTLLRWGQSHKIKGNGEVYKFLGILGDSYYVVQKPNDDNLVQRFSLDHQLISEKEYKYIRSGQRLKIHGAVETVSGAFLYSHVFSRKYKEWIIQASKLEYGEFAQPEEIYFQEIDIANSRLNRVFRNYEYDFGQVDGGLIVSEDSTKVAFINIIPGDDFKDEDVIAIGVFDQDLNLLWKDVFYYDFGDRRYGIEQQVVTNSGEIYLVGKLDKDERDEKKNNRKRKKENERKLPNYDYYLYNINQEGILSSRVDVGLGLAPVDVALFFPDRSTDQYLISGFYTDDEHRNRLKGIFFSYGDEEFQRTEMITHEFDTEFLAGLISDKNIEKGRGLEATYRIKDILNYRDGSIGFIAENSYIRDFSQTDIYGRWYDRTVFVSDEIIIPKFDTDGNLLNIQKITKDFSSQVAAYTSYAMAVNSGRTYLLFNDYKSGFERRDLDRRGNLFTDLVVLDEWGRFIGAETLFTDREIELEFNPELCDFDQNVFLIGSKRGNRLSFTTLRFN